MNSPKDQREQRLFERFYEDDAEGYFPTVIHQVFDQFLVVHPEERESANREHNHEEEDVNHENSSNFVGKGCTEEQLTLWEEIVGKLLNISLKNKQAQNSSERIPAKEAWDPIIE